MASDRHTFTLLGPSPGFFHNHSAVLAMALLDLYNRDWTMLDRRHSLRRGDLLQSPPCRGKAAPEPVTHSPLGRS